MRRLLLVAFAALAVVPAGRAWTWPVDGPVLRPFSVDDNPYLGGQHRGIDIGAPVGTAVRAPASGRVSFAGTVPVYGRTLTVQTADGLSVTLVHLGSTAVVKGAAIAEGDAVGTVGPSDEPEVAEPHVYLGIRLTTDPQGYLDPLRFLPRRDVAPVPQLVPQPAPPAAEAPPPPSAAPVAQPAEPVAFPAPPAPDPGPGAAATSVPPATRPTPGLDSHAVAARPPAPSLLPRANPASELAHDRPAGRAAARRLAPASRPAFGAGSRSAAPARSADRRRHVGRTAVGARAATPCNEEARSPKHTRARHSHPRPRFAPGAIRDTLWR